MIACSQVTIPPTLPLVLVGLVYFEVTYRERFKGILTTVIIKSPTMDDALERIRILIPASATQQIVRQNEDGSIWLGEHG